MLGYIVSVYFRLSSHTNNFVWWRLRISKTLEKHAMPHEANAESLKMCCIWLVELDVVAGIVCLKDRK
jgi:hypothetical protein